MYRVDDHVVCLYHPGDCQNPACAVRPVPGKVIKVEPNQFGERYFVQLPCGAQPSVTAKFLSPA
jgi:hypothetical protein